MNLDPKIANSVIDELRVSKIANELEITPGAVSQWRVNGIPKDQKRYLKLVHPALKAWELEKENKE